MHTLHLYVATGALLAAVACSGAPRGGERLNERKGDGGHAAPGASGASVVVQPVRREAVDTVLEGLGQVAAFYTALVRSQVDGRIERTCYVEGQKVRRGELLVQLDARPFAIALRAAEAALQRDEATLKNAELNVQRNAQLLQQKLVSAQTVTDLQASVDQLVGTVMADRAALDAAKLNLDYSRITAPIAGRTGLRLVDPGNIVHAGDANGLVIITQQDPISVLFTLPEDDLPKVAAAMAKHPLVAHVTSRDGSETLGDGEVLLIDNQINAATGTIRLKAVFPNSRDLLWPNQFVRVALHVERQQDALVVPAAALQHGPHGDFVYVVDAQQTAHATQVAVKRVQGERAILTRGPTPGAQVVVDGQFKLHDGARVRAVARADAQP